MEGRAGPDQTGQVWGVDGPPAGLCDVDEFVGQWRSRPRGIPAARRPSSSNALWQSRFSWFAVRR